MNALLRKHCEEWFEKNKGNRPEKSMTLMEETAFRAGAEWTAKWIAHQASWDDVLRTYTVEEPVIADIFSKT